MKISFQCYLAARLTQILFLILLSHPLYSATNGTLGPTSRASFEINLVVGPSVRIDGVSDVSFHQVPAGTTPGPVRSQAMNFKVFSNDSGRVTLTFNSSNPEPEFKMTMNGVPATEDDKAVNVSIDVYNQTNGRGKATNVRRDGDTVTLIKTSDLTNTPENASLIVLANIPDETDSGNYSVTIVIVASPG
ncbi:hypothetical protein ACWJJH_00845 [Endozoicomonadaceae bacterium StTr2]